jgi:hypothetical protein
MRRLQVFIGSSTEGLPVAKALRRQLSVVANVRLWNQGVFDLGEVTLNALIKQTNKVDFAIMVLSNDDIVLNRESKSFSPRDNVIFELGLFMGVIGKSRTLILHPKNPLPKLPSDLAGITTAYYKDVQNHSWKAAVENAAQKFKQRFRELGKFNPSAHYTTDHQRHHRFRENSKKFIKFFRKWYSREGRLSIFCNDLDWLKNPESQGIVEALKQKKDKLDIYIRKPQHDSLAQILASNGAHIHKIKDPVKSAHRMSILDSEGKQYIIIRNKDFASDEIIFIETDSIRNPYLIWLAQDMLKDCYEK